MTCVKPVKMCAKSETAKMTPKNECVCPFIPLLSEKKLHGLFSLQNLCAKFLIESVPFTVD